MKAKLLSGLMLGAALALFAGCNVLSVPFFLFGPEPKIDPTLKKIASDEKNKEVKVVIVTYLGADIRPETSRADRELNDLLAQQLKEGFKENDEKVTVISPRKVVEFQNQHPDWKSSMDPEEIGKHFGADYVIYLEIEELSLLKKNSLNQLYQGQARIAVSLLDVKDHENSTLPKEFECTYPNEAKGGVVMVEPGTSHAGFRQAFLTDVAKRLSWYFTAHTTKSDYAQ